MRRARRTDIDTPRSAHDFVAFKTSSGKFAHSLQHAAGESSLIRAPDFRAAQTRWRLNIPVNNVTQGSGVDPFAATVIPMNDAIFSLLQYAKSSMIRGAYGYRLELIPHELRPMSHMYQSAQEYIFEHVLRYDYLIYPFLAAFSQRFYAQAGPTALSSLQHPDWYLHQGTRAVRTAIIENINDASVLSRISTGVCFLVCSTGMMFRCEETRIHIQAFMKFLPYLDTKDMVGYWKLETIAALDVLISVALGLEPVLRVATSDPGPLSLSEKNLIKESLLSIQQKESHFRSDAYTKVGWDGCPSGVSLDLMRNPTEDLSLDLGCGFDEALTADILHPSISGPLTKLLECLTVAKLVWRAPKYASKRETQWLCRRSQAVLHELLSLNGARKIPSSTSLGKYAECLRLTLIITMTSALYRLHRSRSMQSGRLRAVLSSVVEIRFCNTPRGFRIGDDLEVIDVGELAGHQATRGSDELLLWMLFMGYWASSDTVDTGWFAEAIVRLSRQYLQPRNFSDLESIMMKYLYSKTVQRGSLARVAAMISEVKSPSSDTTSMVESEAQT